MRDLGMLKRLYMLYWRVRACTKSLCFAHKIVLV